MTDPVRPVAPREDELTFEQLRAINKLRCETAFHKVEAWKPWEWSNAMAGECGEACNITKKMNRVWPANEFIKNWNKPEDQRLEELAQRLASEIADVVIYADLLATSIGRSLGDCVRETFNNKSDEIGSPIKLAAAPVPCAAAPAIQQVIDKWNTPVDRAGFGLGMSAEIYDEARADCVMDLREALRATAPTADFFERERPSLRLHIDDWHLLYGVLLEKTSHDVDDGFYALRDRFADALARATGEGARDGIEDRSERVDSVGRGRDAADADRPADRGSDDRGGASDRGAESQADAPPVAVARDPHRLLEQVDDSALWKVLNEADEHKAHWSADAWRQWFVQLVDAASELSCRLEDPDFVVRLRGEATVRPVEE